MKSVLRTVMLAILIGAGTVGAGWWTVPLIALVWTRVFPHAAARIAGAGAALAWGALIGWTAWQAPVLLLARRVSGVLLLPSWGLIALTLLFPALLAAAAARAVRPAPFR